MNASFLKRSLPVASVIGTILATSGSQGALSNGNFATPGTSGQLTINTSLTGWTGGGKEGGFGSQTTPPVFIFAQGTGSQLQSGVTGDNFMGTVSYYGVTNPPTPGVVVTADGDPAWGGSISQTVTGLTVGTQYAVNFTWAGAQQQGFSGNTTEAWAVSLGSSTLNTATVQTPSQTFAGWQTASLDFTATSTSEALKFLAVGSPSGSPPWLLLNNVSLSAVPEPVSLGLLVAGAPLLLRRRRMV